MPKLRIYSAACLVTLSALYGQAWAQAQRVISLLPSATEAVCVLGACDRLVGVDDFSLDPPEVAKLPRLGKTWQPRLEEIVQLQPDLVLVGRAPQVIQKLQALGLNVQEVDALSIEEVRSVLQRLDGLLDTQAAPAVIAAMDQKLDALREQAAKIPAQRVYIELDAALYSAAPSSFIGELLALLGAQNIAAASTTAYPKLSPEYVVQHAPELIIQTYSQGAHAVHTRPGWHRIPALEHGRICPLTAEERRIATRPGPRLAEAAEIFLRCLRMPYRERTP
ncbi:hypothetical protein B5M06_15620 [Comamonas kerstersii]|jgi:iron complex transport system substrate-binding protein|uniref:Fe/B12 periplasmic-binding domain-containing protein n=2 Tax=Comamonas kerstersii TaxID=225992 RepID=A0A0W7YX03_9BURK|nr:helical backbone metal receptor [Comamonas kerstersii]AQZ99466.1 hypothetical protein B5M06_15620 [Comamonas kerstersii]KUF39610.1 hypothetical protein AS359_06005 [Comamonas kerstersii]OOH87809.1 hypothetical protein BMF38_03675 [Comamonas kerstersii]OOH94770.1 hypothetical protein BMF29_03605 [Comamonas kerstersii]